MKLSLRKKPERRTWMKLYEVTDSNYPIEVCEVYIGLFRMGADGSCEIERTRGGGLFWGRRLKWRRVNARGRVIG